MHIVAHVSLDMTSFMLYLLDLVMEYIRHFDIQGHTALQLPSPILSSVMLLSTFHLRSCLWGSWKIGEAGVWGGQTVWTGGARMEGWSNIYWWTAGKGNLPERVPDRSFLPLKTGGRTCWTQSRWISDHLQPWGLAHRKLSLCERIPMGYYWSHNLW